MTDNVRKVFDMLGVEPNEKFKITDSNREYYIDSELNIYCFACNCNDEIKLNSSLMINIIKGKYKIIKLQKEPNKKKLRDLTVEEYKHWQKINCDNIDCDKCIFFNISCHKYNVNCWVNHKELYSDKFLNQEIEVDE